jgi:hypothetical protein
LRSGISTRTGTLPPNDQGGTFSSLNSRRCCLILVDRFRLKRQQIKQAHEEAKQQIDALLTPQQLAGIKECRQERQAGYASGGKTGGKGGRGEPCARMSGGAKGKTQ